jgi:hypothetical protein
MPGSFTATDLGGEQAGRRVIEVADLPNFDRTGA